MKEDFLVIDHNDILRILFLKYSTLLKLKEYSDNKNKDKDITTVLKENKTLNKILDKENTTLKIDSTETQNTEITETTETPNTQITETSNKDDIFSPRKNEIKDHNMISIPLNEIIVKCENDITEEKLEEQKDMEEEKKANENCMTGCNTCSNGCGLVLTGLSYICSCFNYYVSKLCKKIKKLF